VPFVRFARDKRGYEYIYLVHESTRGGRASRPIVLYWYRTPPGVKVGRAPFDEEVRQRLEAQNPDIRFDWRAITSAQPPPPDAEHWRERRRVEKAAKLARLKDERGDGDETAGQDQAAEAGAAEAISMTEEGRDEESPLAVTPELTADEESPPAAPPAAAAEGAAAAIPGGQASRSRRRRRGRRRKPGPGAREGRPAATHAAGAADEPPVPESGSAHRAGPEGSDDSGAEEPADS
jgi:Domain of unknown function (DUF3470)